MNEAMHFLLYLLIVISSVGGLNPLPMDLQGSQLKLLRIQNEVENTKTFQINRTIQHVLVYNLTADQDDLINANIRVETNVTGTGMIPETDLTDCPVIFSWRQSRSEKSWALPLQINSKDSRSGAPIPELIYQAGHTICLDSDQNRPSTVNESLEVLIFVSTCSPLNVTYSILFSYEKTGFLIDLNEPVKDILVSPTITRFYRFNFPTNSNHVIVQVTSANSICMTAAVQSPWCQSINSKSDSKRGQTGEILKYERTWQEMTTIAVIPVTKFEYPEGFFIGFEVHDSDKECQSYNGVSSSSGWLPIQHPNSFSENSSTDALDDRNYRSLLNREKSLRIIIENELPTEEYLHPILYPIYFVLFLIGLTLLIYGMFSYIEKRGVNADLAATDSDLEGLIGDNSVVTDDAEAGSSQLGHPHGQDLGIKNTWSFNDGKPTTKTVQVNSVTPIQVDCSSRGQSSRSAGSKILDSPKRTVQRRESDGSSRKSSASNEENFSPIPSIAVLQEVDRDRDLDLDEPAVLSQSLDDRRQLLHQNVADEEDPDILYEETAWLTMDVFIHKTKKLKKSLNKMHYLIFTIGIFYVLPTIQLLYTYHKIALSTGENDLCYRNYLCSHKLFGWDDFNHIYSNIIYIICGLVFLIFVSNYQHKVQNMEEAKGIQPLNPRKGNGVIHEFGVFYALGLSLVLEGILSGSYHVCPTQVNFQFDTSFMYILAVLSAIKIYQFRHSDPICPHNTFGLLALVAFISVGGLLLSSKIYEAIFFILHIFFVFMTSIYMYYIGHVRDDGGNAVTDYSIFKHSGIKGYISQPSSLFSPKRKHRVRLLFVVPFILLNVFIDVWQMAIQKDFPMYLLYIFAGNMMFYFLYYFFMKAIHGEFFNIQSIQPLIYLLLSAILGFLGVLYFMDKRYDASRSPAESRVMNKPCMIGQFYDTHDVWHFLSAGSIFFFFMTLLTMDDAILLKPRSEIVAF